MVFKKGQTGNAKGRPKKEDLDKVTLLARAHTDFCIKRLREIAAQSKDLKSAQKASDSLLNRGWGTPRQGIDLTSGGQSIAPILISNVIGNSDSDK